MLSNEDGSFIFILNIHGKYLTSFYASLAAGAGLNISGNFAACNNEIERYRLATDSEKQRMINALKASKNPKAKEYLKRFFGIEEEPKYEFNENIPFPVSTWERSYRYKGYGYNMCRETKKKLLQAIKGINVEEEDVSLYTTGGWD